MLLLLIESTSLSYADLITFCLHRHVVLTKCVLKTDDELNTAWRRAENLDSDTPLMVGHVDGDDNVFFTSNALFFKQVL